MSGFGDDRPTTRPFRRDRLQSWASALDPEPTAGDGAACPALRHQAWGAASQSCSPVSLPGDSQRRNSAAGRWPSATKRTSPGRTPALGLGRRSSACCGGRGSRRSWAQWPLLAASQPGSIGASASRHKAPQAKLAKEIVCWPGLSVRPGGGDADPDPTLACSQAAHRGGLCFRLRRLTAIQDGSSWRRDLLAGPDHDRRSNQPMERCRGRALCRQVWGAASQPRGPVSLPPDAAVQQQPQPVVGEVAEAVPDPLNTTAALPSGLLGGLARQRGCYRSARCDRSARQPIRS